MTAPFVRWAVSVQGGQGWWTGGLQFATDKRVRYLSPHRSAAVEAARLWRGTRGPRFEAHLVRVTRKLKPDRGIGSGDQRWAYERGYQAALDEAAGICRERLRYDVTASCSTCVAVMSACANAIAALKGGAK